MKEWDYSERVTSPIISNKRYNQNYCKSNNP